MTTRPGRWCATPRTGRTPVEGGRAELRDAFAAGDISGEHASVACQALDPLPGGLDRDTVAQAETFLAEQARLHDPKALARLGKHLRHILDPNGGDTLAPRRRALGGHPHVRRAAAPGRLLRRERAGSTPS